MLFQRHYFLILTIFLLYLVSISAQAWGGLLVPNEGSAFYTEYTQGKCIHQIQLVLEGHHSFVLTETNLCRGKTQEHNVTGSWRLLSDGKKLQLTNRHGYQRTFIIGIDNLYFEERLDFTKYTTRTLRPSASPSELCRDVSGYLTAQNLLYDDASSVVYELHKLPNSFTARDCLVRGRGCGIVSDAELPQLRIQHIKLADHLPKIWEATPKTFMLRVTDTTWKFVFPKNLTKDIPVTLSFSGDPKITNHGSALLGHQGVAFGLTFMLHKNQVTLLSDKQCELPLHFRALCGSPLAWTVEGNWLELRSQHAVFILESLQDNK